MEVDVFRLMLTAIVIAISIVLIIWVLPQAVFRILRGVFFNPPRPEIIRGKFTFKLTYEINGERTICEDVLICQFDGFGKIKGKGKFRKWSSKLESGKERITLLMDDDKELFYSPILSNPQIAGVCMGDKGDKENYQDDSEVIFPDIWYTKDFEDETSNKCIISVDEMWNKYKIKLINWYKSPPLQNNFK